MNNPRVHILLCKQRQLLALRWATTGILRLKINKKLNEIAEFIEKEEALKKRQFLAKTEVSPGCPCEGCFVPKCARE